MIRNRIWARIWKRTPLPLQSRLGMRAGYFVASHIRSIEDLTWKRAFNGINA